MESQKEVLVFFGAPKGDHLVSEYPLRLLDWKEISSPFANEVDDDTQVLCHVAFSHLF